MNREDREDRERREMTSVPLPAPVICTMTTGDTRPSPQDPEIRDSDRNGPEDQSMALELERERLRRREAEQMA